jgi:hypothetical protein
VAEPFLDSDLLREKGFLIRARMTVAALMGERGITVKQTQLLATDVVVSERWRQDMPFARHERMSAFFDEYGFTVREQDKPAYWALHAKDHEEKREERAEGLLLRLRDIESSAFWILDLTPATDASSEEPPTLQWSFFQMCEVCPSWYARLWSWQEQAGFGELQDRRGGRLHPSHHPERRACSRRLARRRPASSSRGTAWRQHKRGGPSPVPNRLRVAAVVFSEVASEVACTPRCAETISPVVRSEG